MLSKVNRLVRKKDFLQVQRFGQHFLIDDLSLAVFPNKIKKTRVGFVVGTRFSPQATTRNKMKRRLREIFRQELKKINTAVDLVVTVKRTTSRKKNYPKLQQTVEKLLQKSGLLLKK